MLGSKFRVALGERIAPWEDDETVKRNMKRNKLKNIFF